MSLKLVIIGVALLGFVASSLGNEDNKPNLCCPQNEKLYDYHYPCKKNMCKDYYDHSSQNECKLPATFAKNKYCDCEDGYLRTNAGPCVKKEDCNFLIKNEHH
uniref:Protease inibitor Lg1A1 n=1 Tax=Mayetiola destructor TaxID=39758 RepID=Q0QVV4_MAYDE|nr:protease inibitor Lg1A1 [Mayetiola destructor]